MKDLDIGEDAAVALRVILDNDDPKSLWALSDTPQGKDLLLGTDWEGQLDLQDAAAMARFDAYIGG